MNFNLDFSCDLVNIALGKSNLNTKLSSNRGFGDLLDSLGINIDDTNLEQKNEDCNFLELLIQNLYSDLNNLKFFDNSFDEKEKLLNCINENILSINNNSNLNFELLDRDKILSLNQDELNQYIELNFNLDKKFKLNEMAKKADGLNLNLAKNAINKDYNSKNEIEELDNEIKSLKSYEELNVSSKINKTNIISIDKKEDKKDNDLSILENIVDKNLSGFSAINNNIFTKDIPIDKNIEQVTIRESNLGDDFIKMVKYLKNNDIEEIKVNIKPRELGDMTIKLLKESEDTKIFIQVGKEETFNMLNKNLHDINKHLSDLGIKANDVVLELKSNDQNFFADNLSQEFSRKEEQQNKKRNSNKNIKEIDSIKEIEVNKLDESNLNILA